MDTIIDIRNLTKRYGYFLALNDVNISFPRGKIIGLLGPNGAGKTTLIKIITGLVKDYSGVVLVNDQPIGITSKKVISYLPDKDFLNNSWSCKYALNYYKDFFNDFDEDKAINLFNKLDIPLDKRFKDLSKGTREKVQLILTLSRNAELYIFDEPIAGVDPAAREMIFHLIMENYNKNASIIISTHLISEVEDVLTDFVFINKGKIIRSGDVSETTHLENKSLNDIFKEEFRCF